MRITKIYHQEHRKKRISCNICEQKFNKKETYEKHMKKVHGGKQENMKIISDQNLVQTTIPFLRNHLRASEALI